MEYREIVSAAKRLSMGEQLQLVEELLRSIRQSAAKTPRGKRRHVKPFLELRGALRPEGPLPTDDEIADEYTRHLIEKYL